MQIHDDRDKANKVLKNKMYFNSLSHAV